MSNHDRVNILIVDDVPDKLLSLQAVLEGLEENIVMAGSGREALRKLTEEEFAVVLLDVNMPDMDGFETAALIRQRKKFAHLPILFVTAYADEVYAARGYSLGAVDYILSPVVPEILRTKVGVFVDLYRKTLEIQRLAEERVTLAREQAARAAAEEATRRSTFLAEASTVLSSSLDYEATLRGFLRLMVPTLGDLSLVTLVDDARLPRQTELTWIGAVDGQLHNLSKQGLYAMPLAEQLQRVLVTGKSRFLPNLEGPTPVADGPDFAPRSAVLIPLLARERTLGAILLATGPSGRCYSPADLVLVEDLAGRAAIALDNARLYRNIHESDRRKNEFLSMLAHELRNPLAPIRNAAHILQKMGEANPELQWASNVINRQVQHLVRMVDDLLDVARITRGKIHLQVETVDLSAVVARAVETSRPLVEERKQQLDVNVPIEPTWVKGDATRLAQVLTNLLNNAAKYTDEGGHIWLTLQRGGRSTEHKTQNGEHAESAAEHSSPQGPGLRWVEVRVRDTGVGISPDMLPTVFDLFTQGSRSLDRSQGGLGIGLTLVRRLVEMHGGSVSAQSAGLGQGSEFVVQLPVLIDARPPGVARADGLELPEGCNPCRILVVEDNPDSAASLARLLGLMGHVVEIALDGPSALETAPRFCPDAVLLDIGLPVMDGYQIARRIRQMPGLEKVVLVATTGYGSAEDRRRSEEAGFNHHLVKPIDLASLGRVLPARAHSSSEEISTAPW